MSLYHVLILNRSEGDGPVWVTLGEVEANSEGSAKRKMLSQRKLNGGTLLAIPDRSWNPELFTSETTTRYVSGTPAKAPAPQQPVAAAQSSLADE